MVAEDQHGAIARNAVFVIEKLFGSHRGEKPIRNLQGAVSIHALLLYNLLPKISSWRSLEQVAAVLNLFLHFFARLSEYLWKEEGAGSREAGGGGGNLRIRAASSGVGSREILNFEF
jgi:hypothetical protein